MLGPWRLAFALLTAAASWTALAQQPVKFVLADRVVVADPTPDSHLRADQPLLELFQSKFEAAFPGQVKRLHVDSPDGMISPNERVILIIPTITAARMAHEVKIGSIHAMEAFIVGDVSAIDPWTNANLYSGTRMSSANFELGQSAVSLYDQRANEAFWAASNTWLDKAIEQLKANLVPFVLEGSTLSPPEKARKFKGGVWPFGSEKGVKVGMMMNGAGRFAKVSAALAKYSILEDVADASRVMTPGESYSVTLVDKPTERPEPSVELKWVGQPLGPPPGMQLSTLHEDALLGLFNNYLSQGGGIKILPVALTNPATKGQLRAIAEYISNRSKDVQGNYMAFGRDILVQRASETPDRKLELGVLSTYHGSRRKAGGTIEHLYRITFSAAVRIRSGSEDAPVYPIQTIFKHAESYAVVEAAGVRQVDHADAFFTTTRNGIINLAKKVKEGMQAVPGGGNVSREGVVASGSTIDWKGNQPAPFTPITWLRPRGEVKAADGKSLGQFLQPQVPKQGYMNPTNAMAEKLDAGDILRYQVSDTDTRPLVGMRISALPARPSWLLQEPWLLRQAAKLFSEGGGVLVVPMEEGDGTQAGVQRYINLNVSAFSLNLQPAAGYFTGQWRSQILPLESPEPLLKFGIQNDSSSAMPADPLQPWDTDQLGLQYTVESLKKLVDSGTNKGMKLVLAGGP